MKFSLRKKKRKETVKAHPSRSPHPSHSTSLIGLVGGGVVLLGQPLVVGAIGLRFHLVRHVIVAVTNVVQNVATLANKGKAI
jgi:hypothetical protein